MKKRQTDDKNDYDIVKYLKETNFLTNTLTETRNKLENKKFKTEHDHLFFNLKLDRDGTPTTAVIRFLPTKFDAEKIEKGGNPVHILEINRHFFPMMNGQFFVETCPTTIGKPCPVCQYIRPLWDTGIEANKDRYRAMKKRKLYFTNILVLKNPGEPETEKKVFILDLKDAILQLILQRIPEKNDLLGTMNANTGELYFNPFDPFNSANFKLKGFLTKKMIGNFMKRVTDYSGSGFIEKLSSLNEDAFRKVYDKCFDLKEIMGWEEYKVKDFKELKSIFGDGMGMEMETSTTLNNDNGFGNFAGVETIEKEIDEIEKEKFDDAELKTEMENEGIKMKDIEEDIEITDIKNETGANFDDDDDNDINLEEYIN